MSLQGRAAVALTIAAVGASCAAAPASAERKGGTSQVTCAGKGGGKAGEKVFETTYIRYRGRIVASNTTTFICGSDGEWHIVIA